MYSGYLGLGPWGAGDFLQGEPLGAFSLNSVVYYKDGRRRSEARVDTSITTVVVMVFYIIPMTVLCASLVSRYTPLNRVDSEMSRTHLLLTEALILFLCVARQRQDHIKCACSVPPNFAKLTIYTLPALKKLHQICPSGHISPGQSTCCIGMLQGGKRQLQLFHACECAHFCQWMLGRMVIPLQATAKKK